MNQYKNQKAFLALVRAGLWEQDVRLLPHQDIEFQEVYRLATEQSVLGLVLAGLEHVDVKPPKELLLQWIGEVQQIEQRNKTMNGFVANLIEKLRSEDVYAILVKGQGIAQCYERPLWRSSGDVDLFLNDSNFERAKNFLRPLSSYASQELKGEKHIEFYIDNWPVELHGNLPSRLFMRIDKVLDDVQKAIFYGGNVRSWMNNDTQVFLPSVDCDVVFVFTHFLKHFYRGGIGIRQICDWSRFLWCFRHSLNMSLLEKRIKKMGLMSEWKAFAYFSVHHLGTPANVMPFYTPSNKWRRKSDKICSYILEVGNFGHNRDHSYYNKYPYVIWKFISFWKHTKDSLRFFVIFPVDSMKVWRMMTLEGFSELLSRR